MSDFTCRYCGEIKSLENDRDYDMGLYLAKQASFAALGHTNFVSPYLVCKMCADEVRKEMEDAE